jgi:hypothetical protein
VISGAVTAATLAPQWPDTNYSQLIGAAAVISSLVQFCTSVLCTTNKTKYT